ncbi:hypothetical protein BDW69DRAFT_197698 [Aspergillus filifer]
MVEVEQYRLPPKNLMPNSPRALLHNKNVLSKSPNSSHCSPKQVWDLFTRNGWNLSHYHFQAHECMAVLSGTATIRFGVGDTSDDLDASTYGSARESGGIELRAEAGDVFVIPAGIAHKTYNTAPQAEFKLLIPGSGHGIEADDSRRALDEVQLDGFTMMGAYNGGEWDFVKGGGEFERVWSVPKPKRDPVLGRSEQGVGYDMAWERY